mgnify:CR=1 FL=1
MKGISQLKAKENTIRYKTMYEKWKLGATLQEIGENYAISKQRVWQIITRCKLGDGDYYAGVDVARNNWLKFKELHGNLQKAQENYKQCLIIFLITSNVFIDFSMSMLEVASSKIKQSGFFNKDLIINIVCICPDDSFIKGNSSKFSTSNF